MRLSLILISAVIFVVSCAKNNSVVPEVPEPGSIDTLPDTIALPPDFSPIAKVLDDSVPKVFGGKCYTVINVDGKLVFSKGYGGYTGTTRVLIASCTKWLSAAVIMAMVDEGKFSLNDTIGKYLPVFSENRKGNVPIRYLFSHTSGFPGNSSQGYELNETITLAGAVDLIAKNVPLRNKPGEVFEYGGVSMHIAARIAEVVSGKNWNTLIDEKIYKPCGMLETDFGPSLNPLIAGGARSTANDYIKFLDMIMRKGVGVNGARVLSENSVLEMEKDQTLDARVTGTPYPEAYFQFGLYGLGNWRDLTDASDNLLENSSPGAFGSHPWVNRSKKISGFILTFLPTAGAGGITLGTSVKVRQLARDIAK